MQVSVVIPAHNAAGTLGQALASLRAQTFSAWEAVVVDDGSTDNTSAVAAHQAGQDGRIRLLRQPRGGVSAARNTGIAAARYDWLVFLDADDTLAPEYLSRMTRVIAADASLDIVHCGSVRVTPDGRRRPPDFAPPLDSGPFEVLGRQCAFAVHACVVRRSLVQAVGGFDPGLATHEDWDLWHRLARAGARFGSVPEVLAIYRMRPKSASSHAERGLADGLRVLRRTHGPDLRVPCPRPEYAGGLPADELPELLFCLAAWSAGLVLGEGGDPRPLLRLLGKVRAPRLDPVDVASCLYDAMLLPTCRTERDWGELWPVAARELDSFLSALELRSGAPHLARRARYRLEQRILDRAEFRGSLTIGAAHAARIDAGRVVSDVRLPGGVERLRCIVEAAGQEIGIIELPAAGGGVAATAIADAIIAELAWPLLRARIRAGLSHDHRLRRRLASLMLEGRTLRLALRTLWGGARWRRSPKGQEFLWNAARRLLREGALVTTASGGTTAGSPAVRAAPVTTTEEAEGRAAAWPEPVRTSAPLHATPYPSTTGPAVRGHRTAQTTALRSEITDHLPILVYRRIAVDGPPSLADFRIAPGRFEEQLAYLHRNGYYGVTLDTWLAAMAARSPLPGRAVLVTFDGGYLDFLAHAWPLLRRYGFPATVFLVPNAVGSSAHWDAAYGEPAPLLSWPEVRQLRKEGVQFGSLGAAHRPLIGLPAAEVLREGTRARAVLERELGAPVSAIAYPYGDHDAALRRLLAACGYTCGLTCEPERSRLDGDPMALPRLEITGSDDPATFAGKVGVATRRSPWGAAGSRLKAAARIL